MPNGGNTVAQERTNSFINIINIINATKNSWNLRFPWDWPLLCYQDTQTCLKVKPWRKEIALVCGEFPNDFCHSRTDLKRLLYKHGHNKFEKHVIFYFENKYIVCHKNQELWNTLLLEFLFLSPELSVMTGW